MHDQSGASDKTATLFLSYARADNDFAKRIAAALEEAGFIIWWDALIEGGEAYSRSIAEALDKANARHRALVGALDRFRLGPG